MKRCLVEVPSRFAAVGRFGRVGRGLLAGGASLVSCAWAQGVTVLTEDTLPAPLSQLRVVGPAGPGAFFQVGFGFGTSELPEAGVLHDSLTLILAGFLDGRDRVLATVDVFGLVPKPLVEGAGDFSRTPLTFQNASLDPLLGFDVTSRSAFTLSFPMPEDWLGQGELTAFLASNGDPLKSIAFILPPVLTPEPGPLGLLLVGSAGVLWWCRSTGRVRR